MPHGIYPDEHAAMLQASVGQKWRPSNATEGDIFTSSWCDRCTKGQDGDCQIEMATMIYDEDDPEYPAEWCYGADGQPQCTAYYAEQPAGGEG